MPATGKPDEERQPRDPNPNTERPKPTLQPTPERTPRDTPREQPEDQPKDQPEAGKTEMEDITVPVEVDVDTDALARAATANRRLGIDDDPENSAKMVAAVEDTAATVDITVHQAAGRRLPAPAVAAMARGKEGSGERRKSGGSTRAGVSTSDDDPMSGTSALDPRAPAGPAVHSVTVNDRTWTWTDDDEGGVPEEAREIARRADEANLQTTGIPMSRRR